jgi:predicted flap endonuclease-1-like 5' DNA nuclease
VRLAGGPLGDVQDRVAAAVGDGMDRLKWRLGLAPDWRPERRRAYQWPDRDRETGAVAAAVTERGQSIEEAPASPGGWAWTEDGAADGEAYAPEEDAADGSQAAEFDETVGAEAEFRETEMMRPAGLAEPRAGVPDHLQRIWGIGKRNEAMLNSLGIYHFSQIAAWTPAEARWVAARLAFPERLERDNWIGQAIVLATGGDPSTVIPSNQANASEPDEN